MAKLGGDGRADDFGCVDEAGRGVGNDAASVAFLRFHRSGQDQGTHRDRRPGGPTTGGGAGSCSLERPARPGKTTLANIIAKAMGANLKSTSGPTIEKAGDLAGLLTNLEEGDVLLIDEIHRMQRKIEE